jgi:hypothetical protein
MPSRRFLQRHSVLFGCFLLLVAIAGLLWLLRPVPDPVLEGRKISELLATAFGESPAYFTNSAQANRWIQERASVHQIINTGLPRDTMPLIASWLNAYDGPGFPKLQALLRRAGLASATKRINKRVIAANAIASRPELAGWSEHLIPTLAHNLTNHDAEVRAASIKALREVLLRFPPPDPALVVTNVQASLSDGRRLWRFELSQYEELITLSSDRRDAHIHHLQRALAESQRLMLERKLPDSVRPP